MANDKSVEAILDQLDAAAEDFLFPDLGHPYSYLIDARLHAFADEHRWALVVESVGYNPRAGNVLDVLHFFGNCLSGDPGFQNGDFLDRIDNIRDVLADDEPFGVVSGDLVIRGQRVTIDVTPHEPEEGFFRRLTPAHRDLLLADEQELRSRIPDDIPEILRLDEWCQPKLFDTPPSQSEAYRLLAEVLTTGDPARYRPTEEPTTHWSHWPESGEL